jgi:carboxymethylenebutenolidase
MKDHLELNIEAGQVLIPVGAEKIPAYYARPKTSGPHPCVLVVHEIFGVHEYIRDTCRRLANEGFFALTVDLYARFGDATNMTDFKKIYEDIISKTTRSQICGDLDGAFAWLSKSEHADPKRISITGFCWGGTVTWLYAAHNPNLKAGVAWYGRLKGEYNASQTEFPIDIAKTLSVPVLGLYGAKDESIPLESVKQMQDLLDRGKSGSRIIVYPEAGHAFHADYRAFYIESTAKKGWQEMLGWMKGDSRVSP